MNLEPADRLYTSFSLTEEKALGSLYGPIHYPYIRFVVQIKTIVSIHLDRSPSSRTRTEPRSKGPWKRFQNLMWTQPLLTGGPLGVATGFDILAIIVVLAAVAWILLKPLIPEMRLINATPQTAAPPLGEIHK